MHKRNYRKEYDDYQLIIVLVILGLCLSQLTEANNLKGKANESKK